MPESAIVRLVADTRLRGQAGPQPARTYWPAAVPDAPLLVFLPADGIELADRLCRAVCADAGVVVLSVSYRRPLRTYGCADALRATEWAADHVRELGAAPDHLMIAGEGDGAELAAAVAAHARDRGWPPLHHRTLHDLLRPTTRKELR